MSSAAAAPEVGGIRVAAADHERDPLIGLRDVPARQEGGERGRRSGLGRYATVVPQDAPRPHDVVVGHEDHPSTYR